MFPGALKSVSGKDTLRTASRGMIEPVDPKAERLKARKAKKAKRYMTTATIGEVVKLLIDGRGQPPAPPVSEECEDCLRLQRRVA